MRLKVEVVSSTGKGFKSGGQWYNRAKGATFTDFSTLNKGDEIEAFVDNGTWVKDFTLINGAPVVASAPAGVSQSTHSQVNKETQFRTPSEIIRQEAVTAVLTSPSVANMTKDMDASQTAEFIKGMAEKVTNYVITGKFDQEAK